MPHETEFFIYPINVTSLYIFLSGQRKETDKFYTPLTHIMAILSICDDEFKLIFDVDLIPLCKLGSI